MFEAIREWFVCPKYCFEIPSIVTVPTQRLVEILRYSYFQGERISVSCGHLIVTEILRRLVNGESVHGG